ncbi:ribonuclease HI [Nostoc sp. NZL]|uniref:ribonuclease HI n=1 Tax=Nostoc sp. NZL TaxID=2650612 RepID=UPI0018C84663|nr:ribonuclease H [Nostoc sp. NZL]MBG1240552.1 ribonuclease HI [Nostoc sp. NZL]
MKITIYCDGACAGNPGVGGYAAILTSEKYLPKTVSGRVEETTNNRMEIMAALAGLRALKCACDVEIISDSQYLVNTMSKGWKRKVNLDLWQEIDVAADIHNITWTWVKRNSLPQLEECDAIAKSHTN